MNVSHSLPDTAPSNLSRAAIRQYAELVADHHNLFQNGYRADLHQLVENLGGRVDVARSLFSDEALTVFEVGNFVIHLPPLTSERRDRFTIAHELGHYFLHYLYPAKTGESHFGRGSRNSAETQANYFAASLLMPEQKFRDAFEQFAGDEWAIADAFGVSPQAASVRAQTLNLK